MLINKEDHQQPIKTPFYYGWLIVLLGGLGLFFSGPGQTYSISIFIDHYIENYGWSRSLVSSLYSVATLIAGLSLTFIGKKLDKLGHRKMMTIVPLFLAAVALWMSFVINPIMLFFGFLFLRLFGQGSMSLLPQTLIPHWFEQRRGFALSLMGIGGVVGASLIPPLNNWLISTFNLNIAWIFWAVLLTTVMAPTAWLLVRSKPEAIGIDHKAEENKKNNKFIARVHISNDPWTLKEAMQSTAFWFMIYCASISALVNTGIVFHIVSIIGQKDLSPGFAALILSLMALVKFPMNFVAGLVMDRYKVHIVKGLNYILLIIALFLIIQAESKIAFIVYAIIHGLFNAFDEVSTGVIWPNYFGMKNLGSIRGFAMTAMVIGSSLGPLPFGIAFDYFGGYQEILLVMMILPALAVLASFFSTPPVYNE